MPNNITYTIFITSNEPWGDVWFSKQHYANELAKMGHQVYFLNAPSSWSPKYIGRCNLKIQKINNTLSIVDYHNPFPLRLSKEFFMHLNDNILCKKLKKLVPPNRPVIWWQFDPFRFIHLPGFPSAKRIYHIVDPYQHIWSNIEIAKRADLLVLVSNLYKKNYQQLHSETLYIPHGISQEELILDQGKIDAIKQEIGTDYIIFVGTINPDVDILLLEEIAKQVPSKKLVLIGPIKVQNDSIAQLDKLFLYENVSHLGTKKASDLKEYIALASVGIVPYKTKRTENTHRTPLKLLNYIAQSIPIVTSLNYELESLKNKLIFNSIDSDNFIKELKEITSGEKLIDDQLVKEYQASVLYPKLITTILKHA
jgi:hypothetical protein